MLRPEHKNPINRVLIASYRPFINMVLHAPKTVLTVTVLLVVIEFLATQSTGFRIYAGSG